MSYADHFAAHVRLTILLVLSEAPGYRANDSVIYTAIDGLGLPATRDQVRSSIAWLEEQGLVSSEQPAPSMTVACITQRGLDVATARATCPGVQRPAPKA